MAKDRLADLRRNAAYCYGIDDDLEIRGVDETDDHSSETTALNITDENRNSAYMEEFFREVSETRKLIDEISVKVVEVRKVQVDIISAPIADSRKKAQMDEMMADIKKRSNQVRQRLKDMEKKNQEFEKKSASSSGWNADSRIRKTQHATLLTKFIEVMNGYNMQQVHYRDECSKRINRQLVITGKSMPEEQREDHVDNGNFDVFTSGIIMEQQTAQQSLREQSEAIESRHKELEKLEQSLRELHDIFIDLAMLVESQGEKIDSIEWNVQQTRDHVDNATSQLGEAVVKQTQARKRKICIIIAVIIAIIIVVIIIALAVALR